ncbi:hypothetical protein JCM6882_004027 [Rhodosporidiobolus microsporus]
MHTPVLLPLLALSAGLVRASPLPQLPGSAGGAGLNLSSLTGDAGLAGGLEAIIGSGGGGRGNETEGRRFNGVGEEEEAEEDAPPVKTYAVSQDGCVSYGAGGYDSSGFNSSGVDAQGFAPDGYGLDGKLFRHSDLDRRLAATSLRVSDLPRLSFSRHLSSTGFNAQNRTRRGNDREGRDASGNYGTFNVNGRDADGYDVGGFGPDGFSREGRNRQGMDKDGYNLRGRKCVSVSSDPIQPADTAATSPFGQDDDDDAFGDLGEEDGGFGGFDGLDDAF